MEDPVTNNNIKNLEGNLNNGKNSENKAFNKKTLQSLQINNTDKILESFNENSLIYKNDIEKEITKIAPIESYSEKLRNLKDINLLEKEEINSLYKWEHLFNNFRPVNSYTTLSHNEEKENKEENKNEEFKSPVLLVDLPEEQMNLFFHPNINYETTRYNNMNNENIRKSLGKVRINSYNASHINQNVSHNIRPMSMYAPRASNSSYYYSSVFSDYYKEDFKSFCNKMPILKAKLKIYPEKLKSEIERHDINANKKEKILNKLRSNEEIFLDKQDLIIAAKRKNPGPLLKSIFKQNYPGIEVIKEKSKKYLNTMKPYGNDDGNVNYEENDRWRLTNELIKMRNEAKNEKATKELSFNNNQYRKKKRKLYLSYYDSNDPYIVLFYQIIKRIK